MAILQRLNTEQGITVVIVTHDAEIAGHAQRTVSMLDGAVVRDEPVPRQRLLAPPGGGSAGAT